MNSLVVVDSTNLRVEEGAGVIKAQSHPTPLQIAFRSKWPDCRTKNKINRIESPGKELPIAIRTSLFVGYGWEANRIRICPENYPSDLS